MALTYTAKLNLKVWPTNVGAQNIDNSTLEMYKIVLANFQVDDKYIRLQFFQETFLVTNISINVILRILFLTLSNTNIAFADWNLIWKSYTSTKTLLTTKQLQIINWKKFVAVALDSTEEVFVVYMTYLGTEISMYLAQKA